MARFSYSQTLGHAFIAIFKHYSLFFPLVLVMLIGLLFIPFYSSIIKISLGAVQLHLSSIILLIVFYLVMIIISLIVYGWMFALFGQIIKTGATNISKAFKNGIILAWRLLGIGLLLTAAYILFVICVVILFALAGLLRHISPALGIGFGIAIGIVFGAILILSLIAIPYTAPVLAIENKGVFESIKITYKYFIRNKLHSLVMGIISFILLVIAYIPIFLLMLLIGPVNLTMYVLEHPTAYYTYSHIATIPMIVIFIWIIMFYSLAYAQRTKLRLAKSKLLNTN